MKRTIRLDDILGTAEPFATFHDASLLILKIEYEGRDLIAEFDICVGNPNGHDQIGRERRRRGRLCLAGLILWACEPPRITERCEGTPWLMSDGLLEEAPTEEGKRLAITVGADEIAWYLYFNDLNAFAYCITQEARFEWL
jgi:hypothetical protein